MVMPRHVDTPPSRSAPIPPQLAQFECLPVFHFTDQLPTADVLVMGMILHDWNLETKRQLLTKAFDALPKGGALIVYKHLIDDERRKNVAGLLMSLIMLLETQGGFDYTGADCCGWMRDAGFSETYVEELTGVESMVVGLK
jgi:O-methyltransferase